VSSRKPERIVVVGASITGLNALEAARRAGFTGSLTLIGDEVHLPYDRPPLSKAWLDKGDEQKPPHFPSAHALASELGVDVRLGQRATGIDPIRKVVAVGTDEVPYDALVIATGVGPRTFPGTEHLSGVHTLRNLDDAIAVRRAMDAGARVVVIGAGFIGSEVAAAARRRGLDVTILEALPTPLARIVGEAAGSALTELHRKHGTVVECGVTIDSIEGDTSVSGVRLSDGRVFPADLLIVGIGTIPAADWLDGSGVVVDNGIVCDETLFTGVDGIWAAGDIARWFDPRLGALTRIEHWTNAIDQGIRAMENAIDPDAAVEYSTIPYFWSDWYESKIQFAGVAKGEPTLVAGSWGGPSFTALYSNGHDFTGVLTLDRRSDVMKFRALLDRGATLDEALALAASRRDAVIVNNPGTVG
jgi:NADPH-dependent 2,4-dienoyl-CoA reductase/sulfur reductase-like enzyme